MLALLRIQNVPIPQVGDFVTKAGEVFREIRHGPSIRPKPPRVLPFFAVLQMQCLESRTSVLFVIAVRYFS
jgi:hypothetical protein